MRNLLAVIMLLGSLSVFSRAQTYTESSTSVTSNGSFGSVAYFADGTRLYFYYASQICAEVIYNGANGFHFNQGDVFHCGDDPSLISYACTRVSDGTPCSDITDADIPPGVTVDMSFKAPVRVNGNLTGQTADGDVNFTFYRTGRSGRGGGWTTHFTAPVILNYGLTN